MILSSYGSPTTRYKQLMANRLSFNNLQRASGHQLEYLSFVYIIFDSSHPYSTIRSFKLESQLVQCTPLSSFRHLYQPLDWFNVDQIRSIVELKVYLFVLLKWIEIHNAKWHFVPNLSCSELFVLARKFKILFIWFGSLVAKGPYFHWLQSLGYFHSHCTSINMIASQEGWIRDRKTNSHNGRSRWKGLSNGPSISWPN